MLNNYNTRTFPKNNRTRNTPNFRLIPSNVDQYTFYYKRVKSGENPVIGQKIFLHSGQSYWVTSVTHRATGTPGGSRNCGAITVRKCIV